MNRFKVEPASQADFEQLWLNRESRLSQVPGFLAFQMLKGEHRPDHILYVSCSSWVSQAAFQDWTRSAAFRSAHRDVGSRKPLYLEPPRFEGFTVLQALSPGTGAP